MNKESIIFITHAYYNKGGVEEHIRDLSTGLSDEYDCFILTPVITDLGQQYHLIKNSSLLRVFKGNKISWPVTEEEDALSRLAIEQSLKLSHAKIIHIHHLQNWPLNTMKVLVSTKIPCIMTTHDYFLATPIFTMEFSDHPRELLTKEYSNKVFGADISEYLKKRREAITQNYNLIKLHITPSETTKIEISKIFPTKYQVISHGIKNFIPRKKTSSNKVRFGYIGSLIRQKGWEVLVKAFVQANNKNENIELYIYGGGADQEKLEQYIKKTDCKIFYQGHYQRNDIADLTSTFDIGVIPSIFKETFCYTLAEMQQANIPIIASNIGALCEKINSSSGELFEAGNVNELTNKILSFANTFQTKEWSIPKPRSLSNMCNEYKLIYREIGA